MAKAVDFSDGIGRKELQLVRRRFMGLQRERLRRIEGELTGAQRDFLELLPLLFHINHPALPGFVGSDVPAGLPNYSPQRDTLHAARKISRSFSYKKKALRKFSLQGLFLMGSIGSIGHSTGSDFDVWLCHDPKLDQRQLAALRQKVEMVEQWSRELHLEVHIFIINPEDFKKGARDALSRESSGSTQLHLLLEEFYRTGILLAGRHPLWWLVPPDQEQNYEKYTARLLKQRFVAPLDCIDFGGLKDTPPDEFFGAAHWQLYKGIESPYKALLKLLLIEAYSHDYPKVRWLCQSAKEAIYAGKLDPDELDPYLLLFRRVEQYLSERKQDDRLTLARRCFYFKSGQALSRRRADQQDKWRHKMLRTLLQEWGWGKPETLLLDSRPEWKIDQISRERDTLVRELTRSYRILTEFSRTYALSGQVDQEELNLLGRKLYTALERQPGKIDNINLGISNDPVESHLSLHLHRTADGEERWSLFQGQKSPKDLDGERPEKITAGPIELLAWIHLNGIANRQTQLHLYPSDGPVSQKEMTALLANLRRQYTEGYPHHIPMRAFADLSYATSCSLFVNTGIDPMLRLSKTGHQLTSARHDPLSYGANRDCLVENLDLLITTSWGETLLTRHQGTEGLAESICHYLRQSLLRHPEQKAPKVTACGYASAKGSSAAKRVASLFNDICRSLEPGQSGPHGRYLYQAGGAHYLISRQDNDFSYQIMESDSELLQTLGSPQDEFRPMVIDEGALQETPLPTIYENNQEALIQVFLHTGKKESRLYIIDEQGALFRQAIQGSSEQHLLDQQQRFFNELFMLRSLRSESLDHQLLSTPVYNRLKRKRAGGWSIEEVKPPKKHLTDEYLELRLITEGLDLRQSPFLLVCNDREFSSLEFGGDIIHHVAQHILSQRKGGGRYPVYLTGIELSAALSQQEWSTMELLNIKKQLEKRLTDALSELEDLARSNPD
jgi:adenylate cyclase class 1